MKLAAAVPPPWLASIVIRTRRMLVSPGGAVIVVRLVVLAAGEREGAHRGERRASARRESGSSAAWSRRCRRRRTSPPGRRRRRSVDRSAEVQLAVADFAPPGFVLSAGLTAVPPTPEASERSNAPAGPHPNDEKSGGLNESRPRAGRPGVGPVAVQLEVRVWLPAAIVTFEAVVGWWPEPPRPPAGRCGAGSSGSSSCPPAFGGVDEVARALHLDRRVGDRCPPSAPRTTR